MVANQEMMGTNPRRIVLMMCELGYRFWAKERLKSVNKLIVLDIMVYSVLGRIIDATETDRAP